jgi:hypothetical protein
MQSSSPEVSGPLAPYLHHWRTSQAMKAYAKAFRTGFDTSNAEMALFNQAKLAIQLGDNGSI